jgi:hypothetical protein
LNGAASAETAIKNVRIAARINAIRLIIAKALYSAIESGHRWAATALINVNALQSLCSIAVSVATQRDALVHPEYSGKGKD